MPRSNPIPRRLLILGLFAACVWPGAMTAAAPAPPLSAEDKLLVARAGDYLGGLDEEKGRFAQTDPRGAVSEGELYLKRPGRARFVYDPPSNELVVSDGFNVSIVDPRLKTFDRYPLGATPLSLFLSRDVRLDRGVEIVRVDHFSDGFALTARDARHPHAGTVTLAFADDPIRLRQWSLTDAQGQTTTVRIIALEPSPGLDPALFVLRDPRPSRFGAAHP